MDPIDAALAVLQAQMAQQREAEARATASRAPYQGLGGFLAAAGAGARDSIERFDARRNALEGLATGNTDAMFRARLADVIARENDPEFDKWYEPSAIAYALGQSIPDMAAAGILGAIGGGVAGTGVVPGVGTAVGGAAGSVLGGAVLGAADSALSQMDYTGTTDVNRLNALAAGAGIGIADRLGGKFLGLERAGGAVGEAIGGLLGRAGAREATQQMYGSVISGALKGAAGESAAEVVQQAIDRAQIGVDLFNDRAVDEYTQAAALGAILGGGLGAVSGGMERSAAARQEAAAAQQAEERRRTLADEAAQAEAYARMAGGEAGGLLALPGPAPIVVRPDGTAILPPQGPVEQPQRPVETDSPGLVARRRADADARQREMEANAEAERRQREAEAEAQARQRELELNNENLQALRRRAVNLRAQRRGEAELGDALTRAAQLRDPARLANLDATPARAAADGAFYDDEDSPFQPVFVLRTQNNSRRQVDVLGPALNAKADSVRVVDRETGRTEVVPRERLSIMAAPRRIGDAPAVTRGATADAGLPENVAQEERERVVATRQRQFDELMRTLRAQGAEPQSPIETRGFLSRPRPVEPEQPELAIPEPDAFPPGGQGEMRFRDGQGRAPAPTGAGPAPDPAPLPEPPQGELDFTAPRAPGELDLPPGQGQAPPPRPLAPQPAPPPEPPQGALPFPPEQQSLPLPPGQGVAPPPTGAGPAPAPAPLPEPPQGELDFRPPAAPAAPAQPPLGLPTAPPTALAPPAPAAPPPPAARPRPPAPSAAGTRADDTLPPYTGGIPSRVIGKKERVAPEYADFLKDKTLRQTVQRLASHSKAGSSQRALAKQVADALAAFERYGFLRADAIPITFVVGSGAHRIKHSGAKDHTVGLAPNEGGYAIGSLAYGEQAPDREGMYAGRTHIVIRLPEAGDTTSTWATRAPEILLHEAMHALTATLLAGRRNAEPGPYETVPADAPAYVRNLAATVADLRAFGVAVMTDFERAKTDAGHRLHGHPAVVKARQGANIFRNPDEVIGWGFSNPDAQDFLEKTPLYALGIKPSGPLKSAWDTFVSLVRKMLGVSNTEQTALSELVSRATRAVEQYTQEYLQGVRADIAAAGLKPTDPVFSFPGSTTEYDRVRRGLARSAGDPITGAEADAPLRNDMRDVETVAVEAQAVATTDAARMQSAVGPAPTLAAPREPQAGDGGVLRPVQEAARSAAFRRAAQDAVRRELAKLGIVGKAADAVAIRFTNTNVEDTVTTDGNALVVALTTAANIGNVDQAVARLAPQITRATVAFAAKTGIIGPAERQLLLKHAAATVPEGDSRTIAELIDDLYPDDSVDDRDARAIAYAIEDLNRPAANARRGRAPTKATAQNTQAKSAADKVRNMLVGLGRGLQAALRGHNPQVARAVAQRLVNGDIASRIRDRFEAPVEWAGFTKPTAQMQQVADTLRQRLNAMGLSDVGLRMSRVVLKPSDPANLSAPWVEAPDMKGAYLARTITLAFDTYDPNLSVVENVSRIAPALDREAVHALRAQGLWTATSWSSLVSFARKAKDPTSGESFVAKATRVLSPDLPADMPAQRKQDIINEQAVSYAIASNYRNANDRDTAVQRGLDRAVQAVFAQAQAMYDNGIVSPEQILVNARQADQAVRAAKRTALLRTMGRGTRADAAFAYGVADTPNSNVDPSAPGPEQDVAELLGERARNPLADWRASTDLARILGGHKEREVPFGDRIPVLSKVLNPLAQLIGHDQFRLTKGLADGAIADIDTLAVSLGKRMMQLIGRDAAARDAVTAFMTTRDANPQIASVMVDGVAAPNPSFIPNEELRDLAVRAKALVERLGELTVDAGLVAPEDFESWRGQYLPHIRADDMNKGVFNAARLLLSDMSYAKKRAVPSEDEQIARGYIDDPVLRMTTYLAKAGRDLAVSRMYDMIVDISMTQPSGEAWVRDAQLLVPWRGKRWSVFAVEQELDDMQNSRRQVYEWTRFEPDAKRERQMAVLTEHIRSGKLALMTSPAWLEARGVTAAEIARALGVPADAGPAAFQDLSFDTVSSVFDRTVAAANQRLRDNPGAGEARVPLLDALNARISAPPGYEAYQQVPNTARFGRLRGVYLRREIYDIINSTGSIFANAAEGDRAGIGQAARAMEGLTAFFKRAKTVYNPGTHGVNFVGNVMTLATLGGALPQDVVRYVAQAADQIAKAEGDAYEIARQFGVARSGVASGDVNVLTDPQKYAALLQGVDFTGSLSGDTVDGANRVGNQIWQRLSAGAAQVDQKVSDFYQLSDTLFKVAKIQMDLDRGLTGEEAFLNAQDLFFDYTVVPPWVRLVRSIPLGSPFFTWTYLMTGQLVNKLTSNVVLRRNEDGTEFRVPNALFLAGAIGAYSLLNEFFYGAEEFEDEDKERLQTGLPSFARSGAGMMFLGLDEGGRPQFVDLLKYTAFGTVVRAADAMGETRAASETRLVGIPAVLRELGFMTDPLTQLATIAARDENPNSGRQVTPPGATWLEGLGAVGSAAFDVMAPPWAVGMFSGDNPLFGNNGLATGLVTRDSSLIGYEGARPALTWGQKALRMAGVSVYVTDPLPAATKKVEDAVRLRGSLAADVNRIRRDPSLTEEQKADALARGVGQRYLRVREMEEEAKREFAEMGAFYARYRQRVMAKGLPDPRPQDQAEMAAIRQKFRQEDTQRYVEQALAQN